MSSDFIENAINALYAVSPAAGANDFPGRIEILFGTVVSCRRIGSETIRTAHAANDFVGHGWLILLSAS